MPSGLGASEYAKSRTAHRSSWNRQTQHATITPDCMCASRRLGTGYHPAWGPRWTGHACARTSLRGSGCMKLALLLRLATGESGPGHRREGGGALYSLSHLLAL